MKHAERRYASYEPTNLEVKFDGEQVGSHTDKNTTYTLYSVADDLYVVHVEEGNASWLETTVAKDSAKRCWEHSSRSWPKCSLVSRFSHTNTDELAHYLPNDLERSRINDLLL
jgi:hypothetical protein